MSPTRTENQTPDARRDFAVAVVETLRREGFYALWNGGCVRDQLLGRTPKDYDIASTATPDEVIRIFGPRRTVPVGASFGVVMVLGPNKAAGQIEVATFRSDGDYLDGRRPLSVRYCLPEEDARRRDFTINGMFYDPVENCVIDYVGGRDDLTAGIVRAIGDPVARFSEDKLRMLRAIRFAATFRFQLDEATADAVRHHHRELNQVSVERIAQELRRMLAHPTRATSMRLMADTGLLSEVFPEISTASGDLSDSETLSILDHLEEDHFETAMAVLLRPLYQSEKALAPGRVAAINAVCRRLKLSNDESNCICWLIESLVLLDGIATRPLHVLKPLLANPHIDLLLGVSSAVARSRGVAAVDVDFCRRYLAHTSPDVLAPDTLINGRDVMDLGIPAGPAIRDLLATIRNEQLDERIVTREQALLRLQHLFRQ